MSQGEIIENVWSTPINVVVNHNKSSLKIIFGTTVKNFENMDCISKLLKQDENKRNLIFGLDDLHFYIK